MKTTVSSKGQIVIPAELRQQDQIEAGQEFEVERVDRGEYRVVRRATRPNEGVVDWLLVFRSSSGDGGRNTKKTRRQPRDGSER